MNVFISWSGEASRRVALALQSWLPDVIQAVTPFMSELDIPKGQRWNERLREEMSSTSFGLLCVTPDNLKSTALHFEAGALSTAFSESHVCPVLLGVRAGDLGWELGQFQAAPAEADHMLLLLKAINRELPCPLTDQRLTTAFEARWPELETTLKEISIGLSAPPTRTDRDILEELLRSSRSAVRQTEQSTHLSRPEDCQSIGPTVLNEVLVHGGQVANLPLFLTFASHFYDDYATLTGQYVSGTALVPGSTTQISYTIPSDVYDEGNSLQYQDAVSACGYVEVTNSRPTLVFRSYQKLGKPALQDCETGSSGSELG